MFITRSQSSSDPSHSLSKYTKISAPKSPRRFWHFPHSFSTPSDPSPVDSKKDADAQLTMRAPAPVKAGLSSSLGVSSGDVGAGGGRKHAKSPSAGTIDLRPKQYHILHAQDDGREEVLGGGIGRNGSLGATVVRRPSEAVRGMRRVPPSPKHDGDMAEEKLAKQPVGRKLSGSDERREFRVDSGLTPKTGVSKEVNEYSLANLERVFPPRLPQIYTQPKPAPSSPQVSLELTEATPQSSLPPAFPSLIPFASPLHLLPPDFATAPLPLPPARPQPPQELFRARDSYFDFNSSSEDSEEEMLKRGRSIVKGSTPPLRLPIRPRIRSRTRVIASRDVGSISPTSSLASERTIRRSNFAHRPESHLGLESKRDTLRPAPKVPLPPTPFAATVLEISSRSTTLREPSISAGQASTTSKTKDQVVVILEFAYSTTSPSKNDPVRLSLEMLRLGGDGNQVVDLVERTLQAHQPTLGHASSENATVQAGLEEAMNSGLDEARAGQDEEELVTPQGRSRTGRTGGDNSTGNTSSSKPDLTDGESGPDSDLESEYGLETLLRDEYLKSLYIPQKSNLAQLHRDSLAVGLSRHQFSNQYLPPPPPLPFATKLGKEADTSHMEVLARLASRNQHRSHARSRSGSSLAEVVTVAPSQPRPQPDIQDTSKGKTNATTGHGQAKKRAQTRNQYVQQNQRIAKLCIGSTEDGSVRRSEIQLRRGASSGSGGERKQLKLDLSPERRGLGRGQSGIIVEPAKAASYSQPGFKDQQTFAERRNEPDPVVISANRTREVCHVATGHELTSTSTITEIRLLILRDSAPYHILAQRLVTGAFTRGSSIMSEKTRRRVEDEARWLGMSRLVDELGDLGRKKEERRRRGGKGYL